MRLERLAAAILAVTVTACSAEPTPATSTRVPPLHQKTPDKTLMSEIFINVVDPNRKCELHRSPGLQNSGKGNIAREIPCYIGGVKIDGRYGNSVCIELDDISGWIDVDALENAQGEEIKDHINSITPIPQTGCTNSEGVSSQKAIYKDDTIHR